MHLARVCCVGLLIVLPTTWCSAATHFVDLRQVVNVSLEDDGVPDNGKGGWTDEGVNDMYLWPPLPTGTNTLNGCPFDLINPDGNDGKAALALRGANRCTNAPETVEITLPPTKGRYMCVLHTAAARAVSVNHSQIATYTVMYADGTSAEIPVREDQEIEQWYTRHDGKPSPDKAFWPAHIGINARCTNWDMQIGVWAFQWENPHPEKAIVGLRFTSLGRSVPIILAVTIGDQDYAAVAQALKVAGDPPEGYFATRADLEREQILNQMIARAHVKGIRALDLIRNDIIAVTVDAGLTKDGTDVWAGKACKRPELFRITSRDDAAYRTPVHPTKVGWEANERWNGNLGPFKGLILWWHTYYLYLPKPLQSGSTYVLDIEGMATTACVSQATLKYDEKTTPSKVIKINQVAYSSKAGQRYAYLGWWAGDAAKVNYSALKKFSVIDESSGKTALQGDVKLRKADDPFSGEDVSEMDIATLGPGAYHIRIPGFARSDTFHVGGEGMRELYYHTTRAFFHQRCGQELKQPWTWAVKPACHVWCWESGHLVGNSNYTPKPGEEQRAFRGGYHDAADFDHFTYHLKATSQMLDVYEMAQERFKDNDLNLPESGNGIPDVLDEANWALFFYRDHQLTNGAIPLGRGNDCDAFAQNTGGKRPPFGILPPNDASSLEFAAVAAQFARLFLPFDRSNAASYLQAAVHAYAYAKEQPGQSDDRQSQLMACAAAELFETTGQERYNDDLVKLCGKFPQTSGGWNQQLLPWTYITSTRKDVDKSLQSSLRAALLEEADQTVADTGKAAYRMGVGLKDWTGWGICNGGGRWADVCLRAYWLTGEQKYLDAASLNADWQLGCNPLSQTFITGMGYRHPNRPEISGCLYRGGSIGPDHNQPQMAEAGTIKGITTYGIGHGLWWWYTAKVPLWRRYRDLWGSNSECCSEFTIHQTIGPSAMLYESLYVIEEE
jgi:endoglucanase